MWLILSMSSCCKFHNFQTPIIKMCFKPLWVIKDTLIFVLNLKASLKQNLDFTEYTFPSEKMSDSFLILNFNFRTIWNLRFSGYKCQLVGVSCHTMVVCCRTNKTYPVLFFAFLMAHLGSLLKNTCLDDENLLYYIIQGVSKKCYFLYISWVKNNMINWGLLKFITILDTFNIWWFLWRIWLAHYENSIQIK